VPTSCFVLKLSDDDRGDRGLVVSGILIRDAVTIVRQKSLAARACTPYSRRTTNYLALRCYVLNADGLQIPEYSHQGAGGFLELSHHNIGVWSTATRMYPISWQHCVHSLYNRHHFVTTGLNSGRNTITFSPRII
jgi:hypothetical protein